MNNDNGYNPKTQSIKFYDQYWSSPTNNLTFNTSAGWSPGWVCKGTTGMLQFTVDNPGPSLPASVELDYFESGHGTAEATSIGITLNGDGVSGKLNTRQPTPTVWTSPSFSLIQGKATLVVEIYVAAYNELTLRSVGLRVP